MLELQTISAIIFLALLAILVYVKRKGMDTKQVVPYFLYFSMYKTKLGLRLMDRFAKRYRKLMIYAGYLGVFVGFVGMALIGYGLISNIYEIYTSPQARSGVGLVLPFRAGGFAYFVPFFYWIISLFVIAVSHEFSHGLIARAHNLKIKSSGFAFLVTGLRGAGILMIIISLYSKLRMPYSFSVDFSYSSPDLWILVGILLILASYMKFSFAMHGYLPIIPAAFVEPDEKELKKRKHMEQLSVFAAGPFANIALAFLFTIIAYFILAPIAAASIEPSGVKITDYVKASGVLPAESAGISKGEIIKGVDNMQTPYVENLSSALKSKKPEDIVTITTDQSTYTIKLAKNPNNESAAYLGAYLEQDTKIKDGIKERFGEFLPKALIWIYGLFGTLAALNFGIGLFNLAPIGPLDGGRMIHLVLQRIFDEKRANKVWVCIGVLFLLLIFANFIVGIVR